MPPPLTFLLSPSRHMFPYQQNNVDECGRRIIGLLRDYLRSHHWPEQQVLINKWNLPDDTPFNTDQMAALGYALAA